MSLPKLICFKFISTILAFLVTMGPMNFWEKDLGEKGGRNISLMERRGHTHLGKHTCQGRNSNSQGKEVEEIVGGAYVGKRNSQIINRRSSASFWVFCQLNLLLLLELLSHVTLLFNNEFSKRRAHPFFGGLQVPP